jgi:hypothetical protein
MDNGDKVGIPKGCRVGTLYFVKNNATKCAEALTTAKKSPHTVARVSENIGDGLPHRVMATYYKVIQGR